MRIKEKFNLVYLHFIIIAVCFIIIYTFLNWVLFIKTDFITIKEQVINFWMPCLLPWIPILIFLRPRIKLLSFKNENASFLYQFLAVFAIAAPTIITQGFLTTATGKLTQLENIRQYDERKEATK